VIVQGFGNVGSQAARLMHESGYKIIGVGDVTGGAFNPSGIDIPRLLEYAGQHKTLEGYEGGDNIGAQEILEQDCEVLLPAATESVITSKNAHKVKAHLLVEGANSPTTPPADDILFERGVFVIPDILANAGGVTVSYFEWVQDRQGYFWSEATVNDRLKQIMVSAFDSVAFTLKLRGLYA
jgi:glutamate dehydrogenase (NAD(P)+)